MKIHVCTECKKPKKKRVEAGETRLTGAEVYEELCSWVERHPDVRERVTIKGKRCLDQCKKGPNAYIKSTRTFRHRLTRERLEQLERELARMVKGDD